jgi:putative hydrolase of the HAD superfamily
MLFDIYGTLFISASGDIGIAKGGKKPLRQLDSLLNRFDIGLSSKHLLAAYYRAIETDHRNSQASGIAFPEVDIMRIWKKVLGSASSEQVRDFAVAFELLSNPTYPMPNLAKLLEACRKSNARMGLISNAQFYTPLLFQWFLNADAETLGFDPDLVFFSYRHGHAKPGQHLYQLAANQLRRMKIPVASVLYVGNDMLNDIYPAQQIGFLTALFAGDARSLRMREDDPRCRDIEPNLVVTDLKQLIPYLPPQQAASS